MEMINLKLDILFFFIYMCFVRQKKGEIRGLNIIHLM